MSLKCPHCPPCPGCPGILEGDLLQSRLKALQSLARSRGAHLREVLTGPGRHFRLRARLAVRGRPNSPKIGLFEAGSHRIVDIPDCPIHHPAINSTVRTIKALMRRHHILPWHERRHAGLLRYLQIVVQRHTEKVQVTLVVTDMAAPELEPLVSDLVAAPGLNLHSLWLNENRDSGNAILGDRFDHRSGPEFVEETFAEAGLFFHPGAFGQANLNLAERMVRCVHEEVKDDRHVLEFHGGVGAIGLGLVQRSASVTVNEISPFALKGLNHSLDLLPPLQRQRAALAAGPAATVRHLTEKAQTVICDPPRRGLEPELLRHLTENPPPQLILIYCGFEAFLRDVETLVSQGHQHLTTIQPVHLFPHTSHLEVLAFLHRRDT